jgi:DNA-binding transcriptional MocR family regulator
MPAARIVCTRSSRSMLPAAITGLSTAAAPEHRIVVGTFARAISPALFLGFIAAPKDVVQALAQLIAQEQLQASWPVQMSAN